MEKSILTINSIRYTLAHLFKIANPKQNLKYEIHYNHKDNKVIVEFIDCNKKIVFNIVSSDKWYELINDIGKIKWVKSLYVKQLEDIGFEKFPIIFWQNDKEQIIDINKNEIVFYIDIISSSFFMLSRWEEIIDESKDKHKRSLAKHSVSYKRGFLNIPIVDVYGMVLRNYLRVLFQGMDLGHNDFSVKLSHDIDEVKRFSGFNKTIRTIIGRDLIINKNISRAINSFKQAIKTIMNSEEDPYIKGIYKLAEISRKYNMDSAFYFKTSNKNSYDSGYEIDETIKNVIENLKKRNFEIGFHPGYKAFEDYNIFIAEKNKMDKILGYSCYGGRHHYLRFEIPTTWYYWEKAKLKYDSTLGYPDQVGFRCGTCHPFKGFDIERDREINILEIPLIVMDATLIGYQKLTPKEGIKYIIDLAEKSKKVEGVFTILWHNGLVFNEFQPWFNIYIEVIKNLSNPL